MVLEVYLKRLLETRGFAHKEVLFRLRDYLRKTPERDVAKQIRDIWDLDLLRYLWEAGLSGYLQRVVLYQFREIEKVRKAKK